MPKGTIRNPGSKKPLISAKTWAGEQLPLRTKAQLAARTKNMLRENFNADANAAKTKRDIRSDASVSRVKKIKAPVGKGGR